MRTKKGKEIESAQSFYRKLGYVDCGALVLHDTPLEQPMEIQPNHKAVC